MLAVLVDVQLSHNARFLKCAVKQQALLVRHRAIEGAHRDTEWWVGDTWPVEVRNGVGPRGNLSLLLYISAHEAPDPAFTRVEPLPVCGDGLARYFEQIHHRRDYGHGLHRAVDAAHSKVTFEVGDAIGRTEQR